MRVIEKSWQVVEMIVEEEPNDCSVCGSHLINAVHNLSPAHPNVRYQVTCDWYGCPQSPASYGTTLPEAITNWNREWGEK